MNVNVVWRGRGEGKLRYFVESCIVYELFPKFLSIKSVAFSINVSSIDSNVAS